MDGNAAGGLVGPSRGPTGQGPGPEAKQASEAPLAPLASLTASLHAGHHVYVGTG